MIEVILWDIGNVLLKTIHEDIIDGIYKIKANNIDANVFNESVSKVLDKSFYGRVSLEETWNELAEIVGLNTQHNMACIKKFVKVNRNEELIKFISAAHSNGYQIGIMSDLSQIGFNVIQTYYKDLLAICSKDLFFVSTNLGLTKVRDGEQWFETVTKKLKTDVSKVLFVDDDRKIITLANEIGMNGVLYCKEKREKSWDEANKKLIQELSKFGI